MCKAQLLGDPWGQLAHLSTLLKERVGQPGLDATAAQMPRRPQVIRLDRKPAENPPENVPVPLELPLGAELEAQLALASHCRWRLRALGSFAEGREGEAEQEGACGGEVGEGRSRWGPAPEQPTFRESGSQVLLGPSRASAPPHGAPTSFTSWPLQALLFEAIAAVRAGLV